MKTICTAPVLDAGRHVRAKIGYVLLATEQTVQDDVFSLRPRGVGVHFTRVQSVDSITPETLKAQLRDLPRAAATLLPDGSLDTICYACTSGSFVMGENAVCDALRAGAPRARATTLVSGVRRAFDVLGVKRLVVGTPYIDSVNRLEEVYLRERGYEVLAIHGLGLEKDSDMVRVTPRFLAEFAVSLDRPDADAVFISCGALRSLGVVEEVERQLGKPVIVSNQAMIWHTLRLSGVDDAISGYGRLLRDH